MTTTKVERGAWGTPIKIAIGEHLLGESDPCTAAQMAPTVGSHQSNVKKIADHMVEEGLLIAGQPSRGQVARGRPADSAYKLDPRQRQSLEAVLEESRTPGALCAGQQLVFASTPDTKALDLMRVAAESAAAARISWAAFVDGQPQECVIAFDGDDAFSRAGDLMDALAAAQVDSRRATVAGVFDRRAFLRDGLERLNRRPQ